MEHVSDTHTHTQQLTLSSTFFWTFQIRYINLTTRLIQLQRITKKDAITFHAKNSDFGNVAFYLVVQEKIRWDFQ